MSVEFTTEIFPGLELSRDAFTQRFGPYSVGVDGIIPEEPWEDLDLPVSNRNHHNGVHRFFTLATSPQLLMDIRMKVFEWNWRDDDGIMHIHLKQSDCDEDNIGAYALLRMYTECLGTHNVLLNRLIHVLGMQDATGGSYPYDPDMEFLEVLAWIMRPYRLFRKNGGIERANPAEYLAVLEEGYHNIREYLAGRGGRVKMNMQYSLISGNEAFAEVQEIGEYARLKMFNKDHILAFISSQALTNGRWKHTLGRQGPAVNVDYVGLAHELNRLEQPESGRWGGGDSFCCSPRVVGSRFTPKEVIEIRNDFEGKRRQERFARRKAFIVTPA